jgi:hypothetical protein
VKITGAKRFHIEGELLEGQVADEETESTILRKFGHFISENIVLLSALTAVVSLSAFVVTRNRS